MLSLLAAILWVFVATGVAALPLRWQRGPGIALIAVAPGLIYLLGRDHGWFAAAFGTFALVSMFRRPLLHVLSRLRRAPAPEVKE
ncbi:hypothetical protein PhaeoP18_00873 [Phaeobacter piscinae]|uniref:UDP-N-acetylmuramate--alanine ligase n=1 Tax=Phaeobacter piscinae TaxID=1580596 RepID=A0AAN1GPL3_9RHOB|nr:DUF2484 family protein [Phaeobacter piscinae]ATG42838.1 hypothetical protein PhaeoP13_00888 [Phaeobacter piscinae]AUR35156.1 hypothetical protein PhaeoP18_00873 [Phaeobacter piscinae]